MPDDVYVALAEHLDEMPVGAPMSDELMEILHILFTPEEAELGASLPFMNATLEDISGVVGMPAQGTGRPAGRHGRQGDRLQEREGRGGEIPPAPHRGRLLRDALLAGPGQREGAQAGPLVEQYFMSAFGKEIGDRKTPVLRVVPVEEEIASGSQVLPFETVSKLVEEVDYRAVAYCPCRQLKAYVGEGCEHERENCFHFGSMGRFIVEQGMGREVTLEETLRITEGGPRGGAGLLHRQLRGQGLHHLQLLRLLLRLHPDQKGTGLCERPGPLQLRGPGGRGVLHRVRRLRGTLPGGRHRAGGRGDRPGGRSSCAWGAGYASPAATGEALALQRRSDAGAILSLPEFVAAQMQEKS